MGDSQYHEREDHLNNVVIIGGGPGSLGATIATHLTDMYERVFIFDENPGEFDTKANAAKQIFADTLLQALYKRQPELVINFVGVIDYRLCKDLTIDDFARINDVNMFPLVNCARALANYEGSTNFIQIGSNSASQPFTGMFSYCVSKAAQKMAIKVMAKELAPRTRVNMINPTAFDPGLSHMSTEQVSLFDPELSESQYRTKMIERIPMKRLANIDDLLTTIRFLVKNEFITGQAIELSGGQIL